jgi:hypothetical protein
VAVFEFQGAFGNPQLLVLWDLFQIRNDHCNEISDPQILSCLYKPELACTILWDLGVVDFGFKFASRAGSRVIRRKVKWNFEGALAVETWRILNPDGPLFASLAKRRDHLDAFDWVRKQVFVVKV